ncbi:hypothetical protein O9992_08475 [Vibrio lentus]|nr:hypothetical protein [Vibrio lentus]
MLVASQASRGEPFIVPRGRIPMISGPSLSLRDSFRHQNPGPRCRRAALSVSLHGACNLLHSYV